MNYLNSNYGIYVQNYKYVLTYILIITQVLSKELKFEKEKYKYFQICMYLSISTLVLGPMSNTYTCILGTWL